MTSTIQNNNLSSVATIDVTTTETEKNVPDLSQYSELVFIAQVNSTIRGSVSIPYSKFTSVGDCYIPCVGGSGAYSLYFRHISSTKIKVSSPTANYLSIFGRK